MDVGSGDVSRPNGRKMRSVVGACAAAVLASASFSPLFGENVILGLINVAVVVTFTGTGVLLLSEPEQRGTGVALVLSALFYTTSWWWSWPAAWQVGPVAIISYTCGYLWFVFGVYALLRYPEPRLARRWDTVYVGTLAFWVVAPKLSLTLVGRPTWAGAGFPDSSWWPPAWADRTLFAAGARVADIGLVVVAVAVLVPLLLKVKRSRSADRIDAVPGIVAAATVMVSGCAYLLAQYGSLPESTVEILRTVIGVAALFTPIAFLTSALQRRLSRASLADLVVRLVDSPEPWGVQDQLRRSLPDPDLTIWFWLPELREFSDVEERTCAQPRAEGRFAVEVCNGDKQPLAVLLLDDSLRRHPKLVAPAVAACRFALENTRMQADLRAQLRELQASATRLTQAESDGRRRIERDLHDGAQQTLWAARMSLGEARQLATAGTPSHDAIVQAQRDLQAATDELRQLARGISPPVLTQSGLRAAVASVVERMDMSVVHRIPVERFEAAVESTAYFVVCEALVNAAKHSAAKSTQLDVERRGRELVIRVQDDGRGGAEATTGTGLAGIRDRARAIGGTFHLISNRNEGTLVEVRIPCA